MVDVRDVANALLLVYEKPEASGRYICTPYCIEEVDFIGKLKSFYPNFPYSDRYVFLTESSASSFIIQLISYINSLEFFS